MMRMKRLWSGEMALQHVFWDWAVFGGIIVNITCSGTAFFLIMNDQPILGFIAGYMFSLPYNTLVLVGVWRSAEKFVGERHLANCARIITVIGMIMLSVT
jgi:hypothetical protein